MEHIILPNEYTDIERKVLLQTAIDSITYGIQHNAHIPINLDNYAQHLQEIRSCFVTLHLAKQLRGCIGSLIASRPLIIDVATNAFSAAFNDPRFQPLTNNELKHITLDISVLSQPTPMQVSSEADLLHKLRPGIDGLILSDTGHKATFLPSVWEQLPNTADFVSHLKNKAGWPSNYWSNTIAIATYTTEFIS